MRHRYRLLQSPCSLYSGELGVWRSLTLAWVSDREEQVTFETLPAGLNREYKAVQKKNWFYYSTDEKAAKVLTEYFAQLSIVFKKKKVNTEHLSKI